MKTMNLIQTAAAAILMTGAAMAQSPMTANVPFNFQFGGVNLPAGEYRVNTSRALETGIVLIQNDSTKQAVARIGVAGSPREANYSPKLVFRCGDGGCVLSQVWSPESESQFSVPKSLKAQYSASIALTPSSSKAD